MQKLLILPVVGKLLAGRVSAARVRSLLDGVRGSRLTDIEFDDLWLGMSRRNRDRLWRLLIKYNAERAIHHRRWETALATWNGPLRLVWGLDDPVSGRHVLELAVKIMPDAAVTELGSLPLVRSAAGRRGSRADAPVTGLRVVPETFRRRRHPMPTHR